MTGGGYIAYAQTWERSGQQVSEAASALASVTNRLVDGLSAAGAAWGQDDIGRGFFNGGDGSSGFGASRDEVLGGMASMVNVLGTTGSAMVLAGKRYAAAEQASTLGETAPAAPAAPAADKYSLPAVSAGLPVSDPPPAEWMQILHLIESLVAGCQWPDGSMSGLAGIQNDLSAASAAISQVNETVIAAARAVTADNTGSATQDFASLASRLTGSEGLPWLAEACRGLAGSVDNLIRQKKAARLQFELALAFLAATFIAAQALALFTFGASEAGFLATAEAEATTLRIFLQAVLRAVLEGMWYSGGMDAIAQFSRMDEGLQKGFNLGEFTKSVGEGALAGAVMGGATAGLTSAAGSSALLSRLSDLTESGGLTGVTARTTLAGISGTAGNIAAQAAFNDGHVNFVQAAQGGVGMAAIGEVLGGEHSTSGSPDLATVDDPDLGGTRFDGTTLSGLTDGGTAPDVTQVAAATGVSLRPETVGGPGAGAPATTLGIHDGTAPSDVHLASYGPPAAERPADPGLTDPGLADPGLTTTAGVPVHDVGTGPGPVHDPTATVAGDPAAPAVHDPAAPAVSDPAAPAVHDPASPAVPDPGAPAMHDPAAPAVRDPGAPAVRDPADPAPRAQVSDVTPGHPRADAPGTGHTDPPPSHDAPSHEPQAGTGHGAAADGHADPIKINTDHPRLPARNHDTVTFGHPHGEDGSDIPVFNGRPDTEQPVQGGLGDCGVITTMRAVARTHPEAIEDAIRVNPDGSVTVRLHETRLSDDLTTAEPTGRIIEQRLSPDLPVKRDAPDTPAYANVVRGKASWPGVLEKALSGVDKTWSHERADVNAKFYHNITGAGDVSADRGYARLDRGSMPFMRAEMLTQITGQRAHVVSTDTAQGSADTWQKLLEEGKPVIGATRASKDPLPYKLVASHVYEITGVKDGTVILRNPWGKIHPDPIPIADLPKTVQGSVATLDPVPAPPHVIPAAPAQADVSHHVAAAPAGGRLDQILNARTSGGTVNHSRPGASPAAGPPRYVGRHSAAGVPAGRSGTSRL